MAKATSEPWYRLVVFDAIDEPTAVRDLFCKVTGLHPTDAMQWVARAPGVWPKPLNGGQARELLDGLYVLGVAAEAWLASKFPEVGPPRTIHDAACLPEGFRVTGLRGEPTHWVSWNKVELIAAGRIDLDDEFLPPTPQKWSSAAGAAFRALIFRNPRPFERERRAARVPRDPVGEVFILRKDPRVAFRVVETKMNYAYLGERLGAAASANFPLFVADLVARADEAAITPSTRAFLGFGDPAEAEFPNSQALFDYAVHRLLWSWYTRDRDASRDRPSDETPCGEE